MKKNELKLLKEKIIIDYFDNRLPINDISIKYGMKIGTIKYHLMKSGFNKTSYLINKYSEEFLIEKLKNKTYKELAKELNLTIGEFRSFLSRHTNIKRDTSIYYKKNIVNTEFYTLQKYEKEFYYFVGLFVTDGCFVPNGVKIAIKNVGSDVLLRNIANIAGHDNVKNYRGYNTLVLKDKGLVEKLISIGIPIKRKTYELKDVYIPNIESLYCFLAGALDGDGHIGFQKSKFGYKVALDYSLCNYNLEFLENLKDKINKMLNINSVIYTPKNGKKGLPVLTIGVRNKSKEFFEKMYKISPFYLKSKYKIYYEIINKIMI